MTPPQTPTCKAMEDRGHASDSISAAPEPVLVGSVEAISDEVRKEAIANGKIIDVDDDKDKDNAEAVALSLLVSAPPGTLTRTPKKSKSNKPTVEPTEPSVTNNSTVLPSPLSPHFPCSYLLLNE